MFLASPPRTILAQLSRVKPGIFSRVATEIWGHTGAPSVVKSPDGRSAVIAQYHSGANRGAGSITVYLEIGGKRFPTNIGRLVNSEVQWAPDSKALAVTFSDGGDVGTYNTQIYWIEGDGFWVEDPTASVKAAYASQRRTSQTPPAVRVA
jgi:hypothetical protein